ncbi:MAG: YqgE/AlgH family protein [Gallionellaceae bacterium]|jgi:putative transcriptional regulator|nr:YqgE/AlgH family protein [Gallionellaceae bacterium]
MSDLDLRNHFLIAIPSPSMGDTVFAKSLIYICQHDDQGALGIVVNRPTNLTLGKLFEQIRVPLDDDELKNQPTHFGGPVQTDRGFVLHDPVGHWQSTLNINDHIGLTTSRDILEAVSEGQAPQRLLVALGYAGWSQGQLEQEMAQNAWLSVPAAENILFDLEPEARLPAAMALLGVDYASLSGEAGHA